MKKLVQKLKTLGYVTYKSMVPTKKYYHDILKVSMPFSLKYLFTLIFVISVCANVVISLRNDTLFLSQKNLRDDLARIVSTYPDDLYIRIKDGMLTTSMAQPFFVWITRNSVPTPLLVVSERATSETAPSYNSPLIFARTGVFITTEGKAEFYPYPEDENGSVSKEVVASWVGTLQWMAPALPIFVLLSIFFGSLVGSVFIFLGKLAFLALIASLVYTLFALLKKRVPFKVLLRLAIHGSTAPLIMEGVVWALGLNMYLPFWFPLLTTVFFAGTLYEVYLLHPKKAQHKKNR